MEETKVVLRYRGREVTDEDRVFVGHLIARHPFASRRRLSRLLCEAWGWRQPNGSLCELLCRGLMLALHRAGQIRLPPLRKAPPNNIVRRRAPEPMLLDTSPIEVPLGELRPLEFVQVRRTAGESLFDSLIHHYHYLGYTRPVGEHLKYLVWSSAGRPLAALSFCSAPRHLGPRDRFIGWSAEARRKNIRLVAYNPRFLILPWVRVAHLASHVLSRMMRMLPGEWERFYSHPVWFVETFVDRTRFRGTCYRAANWVYLGQTTGRGKDDRTNKPNRPIKDVLGYTLVERFRELLCRAP